eukprot:scaffold475169_cov32-Prasinocladus_malaysianus.AAC.1
MSTGTVQIEVPHIISMGCARAGHHQKRDYSYWYMLTSLFRETPLGLRNRPSRQGLEPLIHRDWSTVRYQGSTRTRSRYGQLLPQNVRGDRREA